MDITNLAGVLASLEGNQTTDINGVRTNNPLNVEVGDVGYGTVTASGGNKITVFPDPATGLAVGTSKLQGALSQAGSGGPYANATTLGQFLSVWAGNPGTGYINSASAALGFSPSTPISTVQAALGSAGAAASTPPGITGMGTDMGMDMGNALPVFDLSGGTVAGVPDGWLLVAGIAAVALVFWALAS